MLSSIRTPAQEVAFGVLRELLGVAGVISTTSPWRPAAR